MAGYGNPLAAFEAGQANAQGFQDQFTRARAGQALSQGDYAGGANALFRGGDIRGGMAVQDQQRQMQPEQVKETADKLQYLGTIAASLRKVPYEQRKQALGQFRQTFQAMGLPEQMIAQMEGADLSDQTLELFAGQMEQAKWQIMQRRDGSVVGVNQGSMETKEVLPALPASATQHNVPFGWEIGEDGQPRPIQSFVQGKATIAKATRAPLRGRSGGGSSSSYSGLPPGYRPK